MAQLNSTTKWGIGIVVVILGLVVGGPYVYIHFIEGDAPAPLSLSTSNNTSTTTIATSGTDENAPSTTAGSSSGGVVDGTWKPTDSSQVGYRVKEVLFGQSATAVGRTNKVTGTMTINGSTLSTAEFTVDMTSVASDKSQRDNQFKGRIMDTDNFPTATFTLSAPVDFGSVPQEGATITAKATGKLTLKGTTKDVTLDLEADRKGNDIEVNGTFDIVFADWKIDNPSFGPAQTEDKGSLEFLLVLSRS